MPNSTPSMKSITVTMDYATCDKLHAISKHTGIPQQQLYRYALDAYANDPHVPPVDLSPFKQQATQQPTQQDREHTISNEWGDGEVIEEADVLE
jgi:hypothetical protein